MTPIRWVLVGSVLAALVLVALGAILWNAPRRPEFPPAGDPLGPRAPLLLVGIDGATFDLIEPLVAAGRLEVLAGLMERGAWGRFQTLEPTVSPAIWTTLATGKLPGVHGILGFDGVPGQTLSTLPTSQMRQVRAFWNILSERDRSVGLVSWWATWPAEPVRGWIVSDRVAYTRMEAAVRDETPRAREIYPEELTEEVHARVRRPNEITPDEVRRFMPLDDAEVEQLIRGTAYRHGDFLPEFKYVHQADRSTADIALHLMQTRPADVVAVGFYGVDAVSHLTWHFMEPEHFPEASIDETARSKFGPLIPRYYEFVDGLLGELVRAAGPDATVIVFSDHGFGPTGRLPWSGGHGRITPGAPEAPEGVMILSGPAVRRGARLDRPHVLDLAPTLLYLEGLPVAADMPGRILAEGLDPTLLRQTAPRRIATYETSPREGAGEELISDPDLDGATIEKLRSLGYL